MDSDVKEVDEDAGRVISVNLLVPMKSTKLKTFNSKVKIPSESLKWLLIE